MWYFSMQWLVPIVASFTIKQAPCLRYRAAYQNTWERSGSGTILHTGSKNKLYLSPAQDQLLTFYERIHINQRVANWVVGPPLKEYSIEAPVWVSDDDRILQQWELYQPCEKEPTLLCLSVATMATSTISPLYICMVGLKDRLTDKTPVTLFSPLFRIYSQWVSLKDTDNKSHTFHPIL